jgi:S1-C subfamily serine protease
MENHEWHQRRIPLCLQTMSKPTVRKICPKRPEGSDSGMVMRYLVKAVRTGVLEGISGKVPRFLPLLIAVLSGVTWISCGAPAQSTRSLNHPAWRNHTHQIVKDRLTAVAVTRRSDLGNFSNVNPSVIRDRRNLDGGSAAPISEDGYFITANHVLAKAGGNHVFIVYANGGKTITSRARIVWCSDKDDVAILHIGAKTPYYYEWSDSNASMMPGHSVIQGGVVTGAAPVQGKVMSAIKSDGLMAKSGIFHIDMKLQPGDSGGPVVDVDGHLIGINAKVEFLNSLQTEIFIESEAIRPSQGVILAIIDRDRRSL